MKIIAKSRKEKWDEAFQNKSFRHIFIFTFTTLVVLIFFLTKFLDYNETRSGTIINDPFLNLFKPTDVTWLTFLIIYASIILGLFLLSREPKRLLTALHAYILLVVIRIIAMYLLPLDPPENMIELKDPLVEFFGSSKGYLKDLFFSGHTSTVFLLFLTADVKKFKVAFLMLTFLVAGCVLVQHVHYSIDVLIAPFIAYGSYRISTILNNSLK